MPQSGVDSFLWQVSSLEWGRTHHLIDWVKFYISFQHRIGYLRRPCNEHWIGCLWFLWLKPKTGVDLWYEILKHCRCHFKVYISSFTLCVQIHILWDDINICTAMPSDFRHNWDSSTSDGFITWMKIGVGMVISVILVDKEVVLFLKWTNRFKYIQHYKPRQAGQSSCDTQFS